MKDKGIKLPKIDETMFQFSKKGEGPKIWNLIEKWSVCKAGGKASNLADSIDLAITEEMQEYARQAVRMNMPASKPSEPEPFDLARAMAGEPIVTRNGRKVVFVAHDKGADQWNRVLARIDGDGCCALYGEDGRILSSKHPADLFMAPKPKRTVWVNVWPSAPLGLAATAHESKKQAIESASGNVGGKYFVVAYQIEIDA